MATRIWLAFTPAGRLVLRVERVLRVTSIVDEAAAAASAAEEEEEEEEASVMAVPSAGEACTS